MWRLLKRLGSLLSSRQRWQALALVLLLAGGAVLEMIGIGLVPVYIGILADPERVMRHARVVEATGWLGLNPGRLDQQTLLYGGSLLLIMLFTVKFLYTTALAYVRARYIQGIVRSQSVRLYDAYLRAPYEFHLRRNSSELIRNVTAECTRLGEIVLGPLVAIICQLLIILGLLSILFVALPGMAIAAVFALGLLIVPVVSVVSRRIKRMAKAAADGRRRILRATQEGLGGVKELNLLGRRGFFVRRFREALENVLHLQRYLQVQKVGMPAFMEWSAVLAVLTIVLILYPRSDSPTALISTIALFAVAMARLRGSLTSLLNNYAELRSGIVSLDVVDRDLRKLQALGGQAQTGGRSDQEHIPDLTGDIHIDNVWFRYAGSEDYALRGIDLVIRRGEAIGFVGPSGGGKSTLMDVVLGVLGPERGLVKVGGTAIERRMLAWQQMVGYVPQSIFLMDGTIRQNVAFGLEDAEIDEAAISRAVSAAGLDDFVSELPEGLDTTIGERGVRISGGQRQRIAIARALYRDPGVLFMDEATSALDNLTEKAVMEAVDSLKGHRTILIIAHRISTVRNCDRIVFLRDGMVDGEGGYEELVKTHARFQLLAGGGA